MGTNVLEAAAVDLDLRPIARAEVIAPIAGLQSAFAEGVYAEVVDVKAQSQPKTTVEVFNEVRETVGLEPVTAASENNPNELAEAGRDYTRGLLDKAARAGEVYQEQRQSKIREQILDPEKQQIAFDRLDAKLSTQKETLSQLNRFHLGQSVRLESKGSGLRYGAITGIKHRGNLDDTISGSGRASSELGADNPLAPSKWTLNISLADSKREIAVPLSKVNRERDADGAVTISPARVTLGNEEIFELFDKRQTGDREVRQVMRGNMLRAASKFSSKDMGGSQSSEPWRMAEPNRCC